MEQKEQKEQKEQREHIPPLICTWLGGGKVVGWMVGYMGSPKKRYWAIPDFLEGPQPPPPRHTLLEGVSMGLKTLTGFTDIITEKRRRI